MPYLPSRTLEPMQNYQHSRQHHGHAGTRRSCRGTLDDGRGDGCGRRHHQVNALERALAVLDGARAQRVGLHATNPRIEGSRVKELQQARPPGPCSGSVLAVCLQCWMKGSALACVHQKKTKFAGCRRAEYFNKAAHWSRCIVLMCKGCWHAQSSVAMESRRTCWGRACK